MASQHEPASMSQPGSRQYWLARPLSAGPRGPTLCALSVPIPLRYSVTPCSVPEQRCCRGTTVRCLSRCPVLARPYLERPLARSLKRGMNCNGGRSLLTNAPLPRLASPCDLRHAAEVGVTDLF